MARVKSEEGEPGPAAGPSDPFKLTARQREGALLLAGPQPHTLLRGGSRSGKTFLICWAIVRRALFASSSRHAIWRFHYNHAVNSIGKDTMPKVIRMAYPKVAERMGSDLKFSHEGILTLPNKSEIWLGGLDDKERVEKILGMEFATNFFNEGSQIPWHAVELAHSRAAQKCRIDMKGHPNIGGILPIRNIYDMNPPSKRHWSHDLFRKGLIPGTRDPIADPTDYAEMLINPTDNTDNLPESYFKLLAGMSKAKRIRFEKGEWADDGEGMLWNDVMLDDCRIGVVPDGVRIVRIVVGVDPSGAKADKMAEEKKPNAIGIIVMGLGSDGVGYVLEDATMTGGPEEWGQRVAKAAADWNADRVVAERNFGGEMVMFVLKVAKKTLPVKLVTSSRGKALRAEPIAALYEPNQRKIKHVGYFGELEDQMTAMMPQPNGYQGEGSPDRLDAMVFAATELMLGNGYNLGNL